MSDLRNVTEVAVIDGMASVMVKGYAERRKRERSGRPTVSRSIAQQLGTHVPEATVRGWVSIGPSPDGPLAIGTVN